MVGGAARTRHGGTKHKEDRERKGEQQSSTERPLARAERHHDEHWGQGRGERDADRRLDDVIERALVGEVILIGARDLAVREIAAERERANSR